MIEINSLNFDENILKKDLAVVDFWASWCVPCEGYAPIIESVAKEMINVTFGSIKVDDNKELARRYRIMSVPTVLIFKNGERVDFVSGVKSDTQLKEIIRKHM